ncbi:MAG: hypothetical protein IJ087_10885 [Eggerthellaceae bacterium]|nr:hypothetical protein [Eggerthellaceae bacterium]
MRRSDASTRREEREEREEFDPRERRRRERTKARAERMYSKQFVDASTTSVPEEGAPRPALYEGKMGSSHRKSARMQRSSSAGSVTAKVNPVGWLASMNITARALKIATVALCAVLVCTSLYVPAKQFYQAQREHDRLAAEYSIIEKRNDTLDVQNDILASDAGMEDAVRQKYGYVKKGEETAVVTGLSDSATNTSRGSDNIEANVLSSSVKASEEWYTPLLDAFFGVE